MESKSEANIQGLLEISSEFPEKLLSMVKSFAYQTLELIEGRSNIEIFFETFR
jgi:hypothetical protein